MKFTLTKTTTVINEITVDVDDERIRPEFPMEHHGELLAQLHGWDSSTSTSENRITVRDDQYSVSLRNPIND